MNKAEFIEKLSKELGTTKTEANKKINSVIKCITKAMRDNDELRFTGFGTFKAKQIKATEVRTPKVIVAKVPARRRISFSVGSEFKVTVSNK